MALNIGEFRERLEDELALVRDTLAQAALSAGTVTLDQASVGRLSRVDALQQQAVAQDGRQRLALRVRRIEAALDRVRANTFGDCCQCRNEIEAERLRLDATSVFCADCQEDREAEHRMNQ